VSRERPPLSVFSSRPSDPLSLDRFLAALQLSTKRIPEPRDKFVIMQVPCYTEGEESLKKTIDSLANLNYDDKRKLLFVICDGMIVGSGNDRPTPRIVLDILGVDPKLDPEPLLVKSIGEGSKQLNYGKVCRVSSSSERGGKGLTATIISVIRACTSTRATCSRTLS
jgi:cellulose synthase/poly-beta-1,6-N-acetylglucosamine synthase-like glycosyltransferase